METIDCINSRRSRRRFTSEKIPDDTIKGLIECAISAPSSMDCQPWHFIIVNDKDKRQKLAGLKSEDNQEHILTAPITILVCVDTEKSSSRYIEDGVTATQNILLAAHDQGFGSVYVTGCKETNPAVAQNIRQILKLPKNILPVTMLPIGYPDPEEKLDEKKLLDLDSVVHHDSW